MSANECGCRYLEVDENTFRNYPDGTAVNEAIRVLPALFHEKRDSKRVIRIASQLPEKDMIVKILKKNEITLENLDRDISSIKETNTKNLNATLFAIEGAFANVMVDNPFAEQQTVIKFLCRYAKQHELGFDHWRKILSNYLYDNPDNSPLSNVEYWIRYHPGIKLLISEFGLPKDDVLKILIQVADKEKRQHPLECIKALTIMNIPIDEEIYLNIGDDMLKSANGKDCISTRRDYISKGCEIYQLIAKNSVIGVSRQEILKVWATEKEEYDSSKKTLRTASRLLKFNYKPHGLMDKLGL